MKKILVVHPVADEIRHVLDALQDPEHDIRYAVDLTSHLDSVRRDKNQLVILSTAIPGLDLLDFLRKNRGLFEGNLMLINFGRDLEFLLTALQEGAANFFDPDYAAHEIKALVALFFKTRRSLDPQQVLRRHIRKEIKELVLDNTDVFEREKMDLLLGYIIDGMRPLVDRENFTGLSNGIYEILVNAVEHGNLGIDSDTKERMLNEGTYDATLRAMVKENAKRVHVRFENNQERIEIRVRDEGKGFDWKKKNPRDGHAMSGRGLAIARHFFDAVRYNHAGNCVTLVRKLTRT